MNDMSEFRRANASAAPAGPTGAARLKLLMMGAASGGLMIAAGVYVATLVLPVFLHPGVVAGTAAGETEKADIDAKAATVIAYERGKADAAAQAQAKATVDVQVTQKTLDTITESYAPVTALAGLADAACLLGNMFAAATAPTGRVIGDWRNGNTDFNTPGVNQIAQGVAGATCGVGAPLRAGVQAAQLNSVRQVAAVRGMPMTSGAVQAAAAPASSVPEGGEAAALWDYATRQPAEVYSSFMRSLPSGHAFMPEFYKRVAAYRSTHPGT